GDGKPDLVVTNIVANPVSSNVSVLLGNGDGSFRAAMNFAVGAIPAPLTPVSVVVGDFNGDGKLDLAVATGAGISVLLGTGDGTFQAAVNFVVGMNPLDCGKTCH